jgi:hypothetical protein
VDDHAHRMGRSPPGGRACGHDDPGWRVDGICLFSGGLDSLGGVIDLLEAPRQLRLSLLSHIRRRPISTAQDTLLTDLCAHYGGQRLLAKPLFLRPAPPPQSSAAAAGGEEVCRFSPSLTPPAPTDSSSVCLTERFNPYPGGR